MKMVYQWKDARGSRIDPQIVGETVEAIMKRDGKCTPSSLVNEARDDQSPLHPLFDWDDTVAAGNWRTHQARQVINSLTVTVVRNGEQIESPAFISVGHVKATLDAGEGYRPLSVVLERQDFAEEALNEALQKLKAIQTRYATIEKLAPVWHAIERATAA